MEEVNERLFEIAFKLRDNSNVVTADGVVAALGGPFAVPGIGQITYSCLQYLFDVQKAIDSSVACSFACKPVVTLVDLETEAVAALNRACLPSLDEVYKHHKKENQSHDPNEIDLSRQLMDQQDYDDGPAPTRKLKFSDFGIGPFLSYPAVAVKFPCTPKTHSISLEDIFRVTSDAPIPARKDIYGVLCKNFRVSNVLEELGVLFGPRANEYLLTTLGFAEQRSWKPQVTSQSLGETPETKVPKKSFNFGSVPKLKLPAEQSRLSKLFTSVENALDSTFPPSFTKLRSVIEQAVKPSRDTLVDATTEYLLLNIGSSKHRAKRFEKAQEEEGDSEAVEVDQNTKHLDPEAVEDCQNTKLLDNSVTTAPHCPQKHQDLGSKNDAQVQRKRSQPSAAGQVLPPGTEEEEEEEEDSKEEISASKRRKVCVEETLPHLRRDQATSCIPNNELAPYLPSCAGIDRRNFKQIGRWGEALVSRFLQGTNPGWNVIWLNEEQESMASYDIHIIDRETNSFRNSRFIEVKSSRFGNKNTFELSLSEWEFFSKNGGQSINYDIYRVYNACDPANVFVTVVKNPFRLLQEQRIHLCLAI